MGPLATQLMTAARDGDRGAFDHLTRLVGARAHAVAFGLVGHHEDALEATQEAFLKAYRGRSSYDPSQPFLPWFLRILRNTCISHLRKRRVAVSLSPSEDEEGPDFHVVDPRPGPLQHTVALETMDRYRSALAALSARDREILALRHHQELSYREIAETLAIKEGTVMSRLFHARRRLREALEASASSS